ncbi:hypothetical protein [Roseovarius sp. EL26]|uniref:hypothetical protein n=1 Tax=Roseovarius sp. EL26 TaxID=2126672 RepID=UPI000EA20881|nr:hypothetical protein [Roseovarius sp. EL26]
MNIYNFINRNEKFVRFSLAFLLALLPLILTFLPSDSPTENMDTDSKIEWLIDFTRNNILILRVYLVGLGFVAVIYIFYYFFEQKKPIRRSVFIGDEQYLEFCRLRRAIMKSYKNKPLTKEIYATSHCNLVSRLDLAHESNEESLMTINREFFGAVAQKISEPDETSRLNLLVYYDWEDEGFRKSAENEWAVRTSILNANNADKPTNFKPLKLNRKFLTDYFIIEDHTFLTMRKPEANKAQVTCLYIKDDEIADSYRSWLKNIVDSSRYGKEYCDEQAITEELAKSL